MSRRMRYHPIAAALVLLTAAATPAWAYVDPGTGAMLLQMMAAVFAGALFYFRSFWKRVATWFGGRPAEKNSAGETQPDR
jgi:hypothetical protein